MTSHDTALEAAASVIATARKTLAPSELAELVLSACISTLSPDVSGLVERLRNGPVGYISEVGSFHTPPDALHIEAADALTALSLQLAAKDSALRLANEQWEGAIETLRESKTRAETAEASLTLAQEENERLRAASEAEAALKAIRDIAALDDEIGNSSAIVMSRMADIFQHADATLSTPSKAKGEKK